MSTYLSAAIQLHAGLNKAENLACAARLVEEAAAQGAKLVVLPEYFNCLGPLPDVVAQAESIPGPTSEAMGQLAARLQIVLVAGSICERGDSAGRGRNTSLVFGPHGEQLAVYRKLHLFDISLSPELTFEESHWIVPGECVSHFSSSLGNIGQAICYDLRFPELFRQLADSGMQVLAFPSAFSQTTGEAHWEVLLRARAIENQCYVVAANQYGQHSPQFTSYGHSMIVDPWGRILASQATGNGIVLAEVDLERLSQVRSDLPALKHRRK
jgi:deaminated glutathione amidase